MNHKGFKIHALINTYNDYPTLGLAIDSVKDVVDDIIIADGAYQKYYDTYLQYDKTVKPYSTDGTLGIIQALSKTGKMPPIRLIKCPLKPWINQTQKRTALLNAVPIKDWFLILDSDEMFFGNVEAGVQEIMESGCIAGFTPLYNIGADISGFYPFWHPRIFLKLPGMHYARKHWLIEDFAHRIIETEYPVYGTDKFVVTHFKLFRHHRRTAPHMSYMLDMSQSGWLEPKSDMFRSEIKPIEVKTNAV